MFQVGISFLTKMIKVMFGKKVLVGLLALIMFVGYFLVTDPDTKVLEELPFGVQAVLIISIFVIAALAISFIETFTDIYTDAIAKDENVIASKARETSEGAGYVLIAKSIRILSYAIIMASLIFSVNGII